MLFGLLIVMLLMPLAQKIFSIVELRPLRGAYTLPEKKPFTVSDWFEGNFQQASDSYIETHIGLRQALIKIKNQIEFSLFKQTSSWAVIGKDNYLYEEAYIDAYLGKDFIGSAAISDILKKLNYVQQALKKDGIDLIVVFAPGKGSFHKEHIPDSYRPGVKSISNYDYYSGAIKKYPINVIDFNKWFLDRKDTSVYPLYGKFGVHWSRYGAAIATDSLVRFMKQVTRKPIRQVKFKEVNFSDKETESDADMWELLNLVFPIERIKMAYPVFIEGDTLNCIRPNVLTVADSYFFTMGYSGIPDKVYSDSSEYWYYNSKAYSKGKEAEVKDLDLWTKIKDRDVIVIMNNEPGMKYLSNGFIDQVYDLYKKRALNPSTKTEIRYKQAQSQ